MRFIFCIAFILLSSLTEVSGQISCSILILDEITQKPVADVNISSENGYYLGKTNVEGEFLIKSIATQILTLEHVSYTAEQLTVKANSKSLTAELTPKTELLDGVVISAKEPEVVYKDEVYHASDYEFLDKNNLLILTYEKKRMFKRESQADLEILERCKLVCLDDNLEVKTESRLIPEALEIRKDAYNQCFLKSTKSIFFIMITDQGIVLDEMPDDFSLNKNQDLVLNESEGIQLVSDYEESYPEFNYYIIKQGEELEKVCTINDEKLMHLFRAQYRNFQPREKLEAYRMELKTGIDKEVISGYMSGFHKSMYFKAIYAPAFHTNSGFVIFNHITDKAINYNQTGNVLDSTGISYHLKPRKSGWANHLIQDKVTGDIYTYFQVNGNTSLHRINLDTGELEESIKLSYRYPDQIGVLNGEVYYLYRPFGSSQKMYVYKEGSPIEDFLAN
ncbi:MAG: hypothetical protein AB8B53_11035 [Flavobacteriales bacterium]